MTTESTSFEVRGLNVEVKRKDIANLHLGVYPPDGHVRVSAPLAVSDEAIRLAVISKWSWIRRKREGFAAQARLSPREVVSGESHYVFGRRYRLRVVATTGRPGVELVNKSTLELRVHEAATDEQRQSLLENWHRARLRDALEPLTVTWQERIGVEAQYWGIKRMKTKWGSCNPSSKRIWINSELAKKPMECLEMMVVHELVHLVIPNHGDNFSDEMDRLLPDWRTRRSALNTAPLSFEKWSY